jgi:hypothetical protein
MNLYLMPDAPETPDDLRKRAENAESIARALDAECETLRRMLKEAQAGTWVPVAINEVPGDSITRLVAATLPDGYALCCKVTP